MKDFSDSSTSFFSKKEELLNKVQKVAKIGYWEYDLVTNSVSWSDAFKEIHEIPFNENPSMDDCIDTFNEGYRERLKEVLKRGIDFGDPWDEELIFTTPSGKEIWVRSKGEVEINNGEITKLFGICQNINAKKRSEAALTRTKSRLQMATQNATIGVWELDLITNELYWDDTQFRIFGVDKDTFTGKYEDCDKHVHPDDLDKKNVAFTNAIANDTYFETEFRVLRQEDNAVRYIKAYAVIERDEKKRPIRALGTNWDITDLKVSRLKLKRNLESLSEAIENSSIGIAIINLDGYWQHVNKICADTLGYSQDQLLNLTISAITHPKDLKNDRKLYKELKEGKRRNYQIKKRFYHKQGHILHTIVTVTGVYGVEENLLHTLAQIVDITDLAEANKKNEKLLNVTLDQNKHLVNFAHIVSHNLRSHSSNIKMLTQFLNKETDKIELSNIKRMLDQASKGLNETVDYLNEIVNIKFNTASKMRACSLLDAVEKVKKDISLLLDQNKVFLTPNVGKKHFVNAVPAYLESILLNLFTNAVKYSRPDIDPIIEITSKSVEDKIILNFKDNGLGIDLKKHGDKVFGMFKTFHKNKDAKGIGLFITKNQIEAMGGLITIESEVNVGTTFTLIFQKARLKTNKE